MIAVFSALVVYTIIRGCQVLREMPVARNIYLVATIVLFVCLLVGNIAAGSMPPSLGRIIAFIGHTALIFFLYLIISFLIVDIVRLINYFAHFAPEGMLVFRRWAFLISLVIIAGAMIVGNFKFNHPKIVNLEITTGNKPKQNKELKIIAASDIHLGVTINKKKLQQYVKLINEQQPDIVLLAGDICDNVLTPIERQNMNEDLRKISAPLGVYAAPGNHEYIMGSIDDKLCYLESGNIKILRDSAIVVNDEFYIVGRDDRTNTNRKTLNKLTSDLDKSKPIIMLDHQPYELHEAEENGIDLQISGHTHDGQFFPINLIVRNMYENPHGYSTRGNTHYYVSSGLALWGPQYRIGTQSELVVITLKY